MTSASGTWTTSVLIGLPVLAVLFVAFVVGGWFAFRYWLRYRTKEYAKDPDANYSSDRPDKVEVRVFGAVTLLPWLCALILLVSSLFGYWPYKAEYHQYRTVRGTVATIGDRINQASTGKTVVALTSGPQQYNILDTRAALLKTGDQVSLKCKRIYEYGSNNAGYDCKWGR